MPQFTFQQPMLLLLIALIVPIAAALQYARRRKQRVITGMGMSGLIPLDQMKTKWLRQDLFRLIALSLMVLAFARPGYSPKRYSVSKSGRDVIFAMDVSQSMLAEDAYPSRLDAARQGIRDALDGLSSERVSLVVYAGSSSIQCPLTHDYDFLRYMLDQVNPRTVDFGGTSLQSAIEKTVDSVINSSRKGMHDLVVLTDGEDHTKLTDKSAALLKEHELGLLLIGVGDTATGSRIPIEVIGEEGPTSRQYLKHNGEVVTTRLNESGLIQLVNQVDGQYERAGTSSFDLAGIYQQYAASKPTSGSNSAETYVVYKEAAFPILALALCLLTLSELSPRNSPKKTGNFPSSSSSRLGGLGNPNSQSSPAILMAIATLSLFATLDSHAQQAASDTTITDAQVIPPIQTQTELRLRFEEAISHQKEKRYPEALAIYAHIDRSDILDEPTGLATLHFNQGLCHLAQAKQAGEAEPRSALLLARQAQYAFLAAARLAPDFKRAAMRLDPVSQLIDSYQKHIEKEEEEERKQQEQMQKLIDELTELLKQQSKLHQSVPARQQTQRRRGKPLPKPVGPPTNASSLSQQFAKTQSVLHEKGKAIELMMKSLDDSMTRKLQADLNPKTPSHTDAVSVSPTNLPISVLQEPRKLMSVAVRAQVNAIKQLKQWNTWPDARSQQQIAINKIREILEMLSNSGEGESDEGEWDEDYEEDWEMMEESDSEAMNASMSGRGDFASGSSMQALPVPNYSVEDILQEEKGSLQFRQQQRAKGNQGKVEKDW